MEDVVIVAAARTAIGSFTGHAVHHAGGGSPVPRSCEALLARTGPQPNQIDEVILGHVLTAGCGENPARQVAVNSGLPVEVPAFTINKLCSSSLKAVHLGYQSIVDGDNQIVIVGGQENMSLAPHVLANSRAPVRAWATGSCRTPCCSTVWSARSTTTMGITAENIAEKYGIARGAGCLRLCLAAAEGDRRDRQRPVQGSDRRHPDPAEEGEPLVFDTDEFPNHKSTPRSARQAEAGVQKDSTITAGNASGVNDGAAAGADDRRPGGRAGPGSRWRASPATRSRVSITRSPGTARSRPCAS